MQSNTTHCHLEGGERDVKKKKKKGSK